MDVSDKGNPSPPSPQGSTPIMTPTSTPSRRKVEDLTKEELLEMLNKLKTYSQKATEDKKNAEESYDKSIREKEELKEKAMILLKRCRDLELKSKEFDTFKSNMNDTSTSTASTGVVENINSSNTNNNNNISTSNSNSPTTTPSTNINGTNKTTTPTTLTTNDHDQLLASLRAVVEKCEILQQKYDRKCVELSESQEDSLGNTSQG